VRHLRHRLVVLAGVQYDDAAAAVAGESLDLG